MHYHLEIVMPPTTDVMGAVTRIMQPFDENLPETDENKSAGFWDFWEIGGRWTGEKLLCALGKERVRQFHKLLYDHNVTVSSFQAGKPTLEPASQAEKVNALWNAVFPDAPVKECPLFDNYKGATGDIIQLGECPAIECSHVIIAGLDYKGEALQALYMLRDSVWNGVTHQDTKWDGTLASALAEWSEKLAGYKEEWRAANTPQPDWLAVTVDYHS
jgi:hypothetical protein